MKRRNSQEIFVPMPDSEEHFESAKRLAYSLAKMKENKPNLSARYLDDEIGSFWKTSKQA